MHIQSPGPPPVRLYHSAEYRSTAYHSHEYFGADGAAGPVPAKRGGLRALVSKFENMASGNKRPAEQPMVRQTGAIGTKGRGWRGAVGLGTKKEDRKDDRKEELRRQEGSDANGSMQRVDSLEFARNNRADEIKLERKLKPAKDGSEGSVKSQSSLIVRGKKEGMRLLNGLSGRKTRENKSGSQSKTKSNRRESLVQLRVRALETVKGSKVAKDRPSVLREELPIVYRAPAPPNGSEDMNGLTPTTTHTQGSSGGQSGRQRQKLQKPKPISSKPNKSSDLLPKADTSANESLTSQVASVDGSAKRGNVLKKKNPSSQVRNGSESSSGPSVHDFEGDPRAHVPSEAQVFSLAARPDHGAPRKSVAPTIRERITMFESAKDVKGTSIVALLGAGATAALKRRIADEGAEDGAEMKEKDIMKRVEYGRSEEKLQSPQMGMVEEPSLTRGSTQRKHSKSPISRYLEERKRSSIASQGSGGDGKVNGKYQSSFANRHSGVTSPETTNAVLHAVKATTPRKSVGGGHGLPTSISSPAKLGQFAKATGAVISRTHSPTLSPALQDMVMRRQSERNALSAATSKHTSRQPSPHSMDGHNSVNKRASLGQTILTGVPGRAASAIPPELIAPPAAPSGTPPGTIDDRVAELIALAAEDDEPIISKGVAEDYHEIERLGSAMGGMKEVPIGGNQYLKPSKVRDRTHGQTRISVVGVAARNVAPRVRTPLSRSRSSISRMLGRDGPAPEDRKEDRKEGNETSPTTAPMGENKENIPSDEDSLGGKERPGVDRKVSEERRIKEIRRREEEEKTLVIRSEVAISEPKPLRLVEISRMLRMARFGRSRSGGRLSDMKI